MDRAVTGIAAAFLGLSAATAACGGPAKAAGEGGECFRASECAPGLVCLALPSGEKVCTSDLTSINLHEDSGAAAGAMMMPAGDAAPGAGGGGASGSAGSGNGGASGAAGAGGKGGAGGAGG